MKYECPDCGDTFHMINMVNGYCANCKEHFNLEDVERRQALAQTASEAGAGDVPSMYLDATAYIFDALDSFGTESDFEGEQRARKAKAMVEAKDATNERLTRDLAAANAKIASALAVEREDFDFDAVDGAHVSIAVAHRVGFNDCRAIIRKLLGASD